MFSSHASEAADLVDKCRSSTDIKGTFSKRFDFILQVEDKRADIGKEAIEMTQGMDYLNKPATMKHFFLAREGHV